MSASVAAMEARFRSLLLARSPEERLRMGAACSLGYGRDFQPAERERILTYLAVTT
jgi:hypothetical protein